MVIKVNVLSKNWMMEVAATVLKEGWKRTGKKPGKSQKTKGTQKRVSKRPALPKTNRLAKRDRGYQFLDRNINNNDVAARQRQEN